MGYERCPNCGSISVAPLYPSPGATYVLTEVVDKGNGLKSFAGEALPIEIKVCSDCKLMYLYCPTAEKTL